MVFKMTPFMNLWKKNNFQALPISQNIISKIGFSWNQSFFCCSMLGGTIQEPSIQKVYLGFLLTDPTKKTTEIRNEVYVGMSELNFPTILIRLTKATLTIVSCCVKIQNSLKPDKD
jgi:hypothetical protein